MMIHWLRLTLLLAGIVAILPEGLVAREAEVPWQKGMCFAHLHRGDVGYGSEASREQLERLADLNVEWVSVTPFAYQRGHNTPDLFFGHDRTLTLERTGKAMDQAHAAGLQVMMKPHIWLTGRTGHWRGDIAMTTEADWEAWFARYTDFILTYADLAEEKGARILCIGSELKGVTLEREEEWRELIARTRQRFSGMLTYAANWDEYRHVRFWNALDFVGIDAFFPVVDAESPDLETIKRGMEAVAADIDAFHQDTAKPIVLTEIGYKSVEWTTARPFEWHGNTEIDLELQARAYEAACHVFPKKDWCYGMYWWKWFSAPRGGPGNGDFTPQGKPAEEIIARYFGMEPPRG